MKIENQLVGQKAPMTLAIPERRLVCYCRLFQVVDPNKPQKLGVHAREIHLFNDMLLVSFQLFHFRLFVECVIALLCHENLCVMWRESTLYLLREMR